MLREEEQALVQGGKLLQIKQQLDQLQGKFQDQQLERDYQLQRVLVQGNSYLNSARTIREAEALLRQLRSLLTTEGKGTGTLPVGQVQEATAALRSKLEEEEGNARRELQKGLREAAGILLQTMEVTSDIN